MVGREVARSARYTSACVLPDPTGPEKPEYLDWHEPCMCRSRRPSLISSKRPQRVPWWQGKKSPEGGYWSQNSLADGGIRPGGGLRGGTERTNEASAFAEGPSGKSERQLAEQLPRSSL